MSVNEHPLTAAVETATVMNTGELTRMRRGFKPMPHPRCPRHHHAMIWNAALGRFECGENECPMIVKTDEYIMRLEEICEFVDKKNIELQREIAQLKGPSKNTTFQPTIYVDGQKTYIAGMDVGTSNPVVIDLSSVIKQMQTLYNDYETHVALELKIEVRTPQ